MTIPLIITSFIAGVLTILAPCVLPLLPVIVGSTSSSKSPKKLYIVSASLGVSIILFSLLLKGSTLFIQIPQSFWEYISGGIVLLFGLFLVFPNLWNTLSIKLKLDNNAQSLLEKAKQKDSIWGSILVGAALGPVFSSCSPTYLIILATILPANFFTGLLYLCIYTFGLILPLTLIGYFGQKIITKLKWASNPNGIFKKSMGVLLILVGITIITGYNKIIESKILNTGCSVSQIEENLLKAPPKNTQNKTQEFSQQEKYRGYSPEKVLQAQQNGYSYAFFFHADWCSTCQSLEKKILSQKEKLPKKSIIFKVNYDTENKLKKEFNVLTQTTVLFFEEKGTLVDRKINPSFERIINGLSQKKDPNISFTQKKNMKESIQKQKEAKKTFKTAKEYFEFLQKESSLQQATLAGGCFWCLEAPFEAENGVIESFSGYAGGTIENPTYEEVSSGKTGAREAVDIFYDPEIISYEELLEIYWRQIDPTDAGGQFGDRGTHYTTAIFYRNEDQKETAINSKTRLNNTEKFSTIATLILPFESFYLAEEYHQDYYKKSADHYSKYKIGSGRAANIKKNEKTFDEIFIKNEEPSYTKPKENEIQSILNDKSYAVTQKGETEKPFENEYWDNHDPGIYVDIVTGEPLFSSTDKFESGTGWPSFTRPIDDHFIIQEDDNKLNISRTEIKSKIGNSHLGHVFNDGPKEKGGMRYCINSAALRFIPLENMESEGYEKYLSLFQK